MKQSLPAGSCDAHFHVFEDPAAFPFATPRSYTPPVASMADYLAICTQLGISRSVLVHPSVYGRDHSSFEAALIAHPNRLRGVAVVYSDTLDTDIERWHHLGSRGTRFNALFAGGADTNDLRAIADRVRALGWHLQLLIDVGRQPEVLRAAAATGLPVIVDHFGHADAAGAMQSAGFQDLLALLREGRAWVKLSGAYRVSNNRTNYADARPLADALLAANPDQLVWGSDWPHPAIADPQPKVGDLVNLLFEWHDAAQIKKILVHNPARLYGWG